MPLGIFDTDGFCDIVGILDGGIDTDRFTDADGTPDGTIDGMLVGYNDNDGNHIS